MESHARVGFSLARIWIWSRDRILRKPIQVMAALIALIICVYQISFNLASYMEKKTVFTVGEVTSPPPLFPPVIVCLWPPFDPVRLVRLGLDTTSTTINELEINIEGLVGIDRRLTGEQLVRDAAWRLEDMVESLEVGDIKETYDTSNVVSRLWRRSYTPLGPCMTLTAPPYASQHSPNLTIKLRPRPTSLEPCKWVEDDRSVQYDHPDDCPSVRRYCNTSCAWQQYITQNNYLSFYFMSSTDLFIRLSGMQPELRFTKWSTSNLVNVEPYRISSITLQEPDLEPMECFHKCLTSQVEKKFKCKAINEKSIHSPVGALCLTYNLLYHTAQDYIDTNDKTLHCLQYCKQSPNELRWKCKPDLTSDISSLGYISVRLVKPSTLVFKEDEVYPLSQFFTDIGGSLGLFLGLSLLDLWMILLSFLRHQFKGIRAKLSELFIFYSSTEIVRTAFMQLLQQTGLIILSIMSCVHFGLVIKTYVQQSEAMTIRLTASTASIKFSTQNFSLESLLIGRLASRAFGCHIPSPSEYDECMVKCVLQVMDGDFLPFLNVQDLPVCTTARLTFPVLKYVMQISYLQQIASQKAISDCHACNGLNASRKYYISYNIEQEYSYSILNILSNFGGLLGLYLGLSLMNISQGIEAAKLEVLKRLNALLRHLSKFAFVAAVTVVCTALCLLQVLEFLMRHPIYTTTSSQPPTVADLPAVTACVWPPVNIRRLLETAGLSTAYDQVALLSPEDRQAAVTRLLQQLPKTSNVTDPDHLWFASAWTDREMLMDITYLHRNNPYTHSDCYNVTNSLMNRCTVCQPHLNIEGPVTGMQYQVDLTVPQSELNKYTHILSYVHEVGKPPGPELTLASRETISVIEISSVSRWNSLQSSGTSRSECVSRCLDDALVDEVGCRLPWVRRRHDLSPCNMTQFTHFLTALWRLGTQPRDVYKELLAGNTASECYFSCNHLSQTFYKLNTKSIGGMLVTNELSVDVNIVPDDLTEPARQTVVYWFKTGVYETVSVYDGYPLAQLVSELGGIVGMTLGTSLISLLLSLISRVRRQPQ